MISLCSGKPNLKWNFLTRKMSWPLKASLLLLMCFSWSALAVAQLCSVGLGISPSSPVASGTPVTITARIGGPIVDNVYGSVTLNGEEICSFSNAPSSCTYTDSDPSQETNTVAWSCTAEGVGGNGSYTGSQTFTVTPQTSTIGPLYQIVSILYSPPGDQSSQGYGDSTTDATTTTVGSSFTWAQELTFSSSNGVVGGSAYWGYSKTSNNSSAFTTSVTDGTTILTDDNNNSTYNPTESNAINHNLDSFVLWLNPEVTVTTVGSDPVYPVGYSVAPQATAGVSAIITDTLPGPVPAIAMEPKPGSISSKNPSGISSVPLSYLEPQAIANDEGTGNSYMPGLAAICKNQTYYPNNCSGDPNGQCGCTPADFAPILAQDALLNYNTTTLTANPVAGTVSPLESDASGASECGENPVPVDANCRYVIVPEEKGSATPLIEPLSGSAGVTYTLTDGTTTVETIGGSTSENTGFSFALGPALARFTTQDTWTWTQLQSVGNSSGSTNSMSVTLKTSDASCGEDVNIYEDTIYHTFAFQIPTGNFGC